MTSRNASLLILKERMKHGQTAIRQVVGVEWHSGFRNPSVADGLGEDSGRRIHVRVDLSGFDAT
jgi:hypothetical protein